MFVGSETGRKLLFLYKIVGFFFSVICGANLDAFFVGMSFISSG